MEFLGLLHDVASAGLVKGEDVESVGGGVVAAVVVDHGRPR